MQFQNKDNSRVHSVQTIAHLNVLGHAQILELDIGSRCGGHAECAGDVIQISDPDMRMQLSKPTAAEIELLGLQKIDAGYRLACQCFPVRDGAEIVVHHK